MTKNFFLLYLYCFIRAFKQDQNAIAINIQDETNCLID